MSEVPDDTLDVALADGQSGKLNAAACVDVLFSSRVFVLLKDPPSDRGQFDPCVLFNAARNPVLAVFSSTQRMDAWRKIDPSHQYSLLTEFSWLLRGVQPGLGVVVNPGSSVGLELTAERIADLKRARGVP